MNGPDISIEDVSLRLDNSRRHIEGKVQIVIALQNSSKTLSYYVLKRPRVIDYDRGSRTLAIGLYDLPRGETGDTGAFEPEQVVIQPGSTLQWQYLIPVWMKKITRAPGLREVVEVLDISGVQKVDCVVQVRVGDKCGEMVSASFERTIT